ncbi:MAG: putative porin [Tannerella sp.]|nr:putative porin [Tannerella sp.]
MKRFYIVLYAIVVCSVGPAAQNRPAGGRGSFSLSARNAAAQLPDSLAETGDSTATQRITAYRLTGLGDPYVTPMDTSYLNMANRTLPDGQGIAVAHTGNIAAPSQSRIFAERNEGERDFIFADNYDRYVITPRNGCFYDTKVPYSNVLYTRAGGSTYREEQLKIFLTSNFGRKINAGGDFDYVYSRGHYQSNGNKMINYRFFGSYRSDRYEASAHVRNFNMVNSENGGLTNDRYITHPDEFANGRRKVDTQSFPTRFSSVWNRIRGQSFFLSHRYNLGFYRELTEREQEKKRRKEQEKEEQEARAAKEAEKENAGNPDIAPPPPPADVEENQEDLHANEVFVPVSSVIHTIEYENHSRRFVSTDRGHIVDTCYANRFGKADSLLNDYTSMWRLNNTVALALREGFQDWAKFGLTAFASFEQRKFFLPGDSLLGKMKYEEFATFVGAELSKRRGSLLTYRARGELCVLGDDLGEFRIEGDAGTRFRLFGKEASVQVRGYVKNLRPAFYWRHYHGRYFRWDADLNNIQRVYAEGQVAWQQTHTRLSVGVESIQNHVFFNTDGVPEQYGANLQVVTGRLNQDFRYRGFGWENELAYQLSSNDRVLPLPQLSAWSNMYVAFRLVKVLSVQLGADVHYYTSYHVPRYEPATQQFQLQDQMVMGGYPLLNAYANFHLKQTCFFVTGYNLGSLVINHPQYFSMPHYPLNPMVVKIGLAVTFNN